MFRKLICLLLALALVAAPLLGGAGTVRGASVSADEMESQIEKQIRAFADSIDKSGADDAAAAALAKHGLTGGGKTLKVGKTHALTATLFNSELLQGVLIDGCTEAIRSMQELDLSSIPYAGGCVGWYEKGASYYLYVQSASGNYYSDWEWEIISSDNGRSVKPNSYDQSLYWMAGSTNLFLKIERTKTTATEQTYKFTCTVDDYFDFDTSIGSGFDKLISGIGAVLFREFAWESTVTFHLTVPYNCSHSWGAYHWTFDPENRTMTSDAGAGFVENSTREQTYLNTNGVVSRFFELDQTIRLLHNKPWVMEYDIVESGNISFAPQRNHMPSSMVRWTHYHGTGLFAINSDHVVVSNELDYVDYKNGIYFNQYFSYDPSLIYTYRLENKVHPDGSNMVYLTVTNKEKGQILAENVPLDDLYYYERWVKEEVPVSSTSSWLSGVDLHINYFGKRNVVFTPKYFDLRIWENGEEGGSGTYYKGKVTKPTCTAQGYTTYTCSCCGYSYKADKVKAKGHSFGDWTTVTAATCTESGEEQRKCKNCDHSESRTVDAAGHNYENYVCTNCGDMEYIPGDVDLNETVDVDDVLALLWNVLFPEEYPLEANADFDGNGTTDVDDVLALLWHVLFPEDYPLN